MDLPQTAKEFYRRRDDRTGRVSESRDYQNFHVRLAADRATAGSYTGQIALLLAANMLVRWCRWVEFGFLDAPLDPKLQISGWKSLHERISAETQQADPFGTFKFHATRSQEVEYTLWVGNSSLGETADFFISADGWTAYASRTPIQTQNNDLTTPFGARLAACIGVADAFKIATHQPSETRVRNMGFSVFDFHNQPDPTYPPIPQSVDIGNVHLIGVGSVGSAIIYLLRMIPINGRITLIDHDLIEIENLNRSPLFGISEVGESKVQVANRYLEGHSATDPFVCKYDEFINQQGRKPGDVDLLLPEANEYGVRSYIENNFPPLQVYGTTTKSWGVNYHRHMPLSGEDCSLCRFPANEIQPEMVCSQNKVNTEPEKQVDAALPFLSVGAAVLTVADLVKLQFPGYPFTPNFAFIGFKGNMEIIPAYTRRPKETCFCSGRNTSILKRYNSGSKYFRA